MDRPDYGSRTPENMSKLFDHFGRREAPQIEGRLYEELCRGIADDPELLRIAAHAPVTQPPPNLLFAAVHYLLLRGAQHPLRDYYPALRARAVRNGKSLLFREFRDFCLARRSEIEALVASRATQTNVVQRCTVLLPAFAEVFRRGGRRPLALIEIGPSAGLNLQWDRFRYAYRRDSDQRLTARWGDPDATVSVEAQLRGSQRLPELPSQIPVASRSGIELNPIDLDDDDAVMWLRALIWPDHLARQERLSAAIEVAQRHRPRLQAGDAAAALPGAMAATPSEATLCVYGTHTLYQFPADSRRAVYAALGEQGRERPVFFVSSEGTGPGWSEVRLNHYRDGARATVELARCCPHGRWLDWLAPDPRPQ